MTSKTKYLDQLIAFLETEKISQKKAALIAQTDKTNFCLMLNRKLTFGEKESKKGRAFAGTTEDRCKIILSKLIANRITEIEHEIGQTSQKIKSLSNRHLELIDYKKTLEI